MICSAAICSCSYTPSLPLSAGAINPSLLIFNSVNSTATCILKVLVRFLPEEESSTTPPTAAFWELQLGAAIEKKVVELLRGSQIIFGLEQTIEKGKGCVCERESSKAGRGRVKGERGGLRGNKGRQEICGWLDAH